MRAVVVTGAASGIGEATAERLGRAGWRVFGFSHEELEVTDEASARAAAERVGSETGGGLAGLVHSAGIAIAAPLEFVPLDAVRRQLDVNVVGSIAVVQAFLPLLRRGGGRVVLVGSRSGRLATPLLGPYVASKFAVEGLADCLRMELSPWGIPVALVEPGAVRTPMWAKGRAAADELLARMPPQAGELYGARVEAVRRLAGALAERGSPPDEVARTIERALTARRPRARYLVAREARVSAWVARAPERLRDRLVLSRLR